MGGLCATVLIFLQLISFSTVNCLSRTTEFQRYDGWYNNLANADWGTAGARLHRDAPYGYIDGVYMINTSLPSPRDISNLVFKGESGIPNGRNITAMFAYFSQLVAYEIMASTQVSCPLENIKIRVPKCDKVFDSDCEGETDMPFTRSKYDKQTGHGLNSPREQVNERTSWIDASFIYSTYEPWVASQRSFVGGLLEESKEMPGYPPFNNPHIPLNNPPPPQIHRLMKPDRLFILGDSRVNENPGLLSFGLVLFRWHNVVAKDLLEKNPDWTDEELFQGARRWVIATLQKIIMYDFLPVLLREGENLPKYDQYKPDVPPGISHAFSAAAFRFPHSIVPPGMLLRKNGSTCEFRQEIGGYPALRLCQNWWNAQDIVREYSVDEIILGMASQIAEANDNIVVEDLRDFIFGPMHFTRLDVVSQSIMRGRDNGLPPYNTLRKAFNLKRRDWDEINPEFFATRQETLDQLKSYYGGNIDILDAYVGGMLEGNDSGPGELFTVIIKDQFRRIRDGDRFWYENRQNEFFTEEEIAEINTITLATIIKRTTFISEPLLQQNVFFWREGDPCPQPFQVNATNLEPCVPFMRFDHFTGNEVTYIFTLIGLGCIPLICFGIGYALIQRRNRMGWDASFDQYSCVGIDDDEPKDRYHVHAIEWLQETYVRHVVVSIEKGTLVVKKPRGSILRKIVFPKNCEVVVTHSPPNASKMYGPYCLISLPRTHDLVIRLPSDKHLTHFLEQLSDSLKPINSTLADPIIEQNDELLAKAETKDRRQYRLDHFFREACARAFNETELSDSTSTFESEEDILEETITRHEMAQAFGMKEDNAFMKRIYAVCTKADSDEISFQEVIEFFKNFTRGSAEEKCRLMFNLCDVNRTGRVNRKELASFLKGLNDSVGVAITEQDQLRVIECLLSRSGSNVSETLTYEEFNLIFTDAESNNPVCMDLRGLPALSRKQLRGDIDDASSVSSFAVKQTREPVKFVQKYWHKFRAYVETYRQHIVIMFIFLAINLYIFLERFFHYRFETEHRDLRRVMGVGIAITRGAAGALSFDMGLILLTVCRNVITLVREWPIGEYIPFDSAITFHKIVALLTLFWAALHTVGHCVNFYHVATQSQEGLHCLFQEAVFGSNFLPTISYWFFQTITGLTGICLVAVISIIYVFALPCFIQRAYHAFRLTHLLNVAFYALTMLHGLPKLLDSPKFQFYVIGPIVVFIIDKIMGMRNEYKQLPVYKALILPSDVIYVQFKRPLSFLFRSGQWVRVSSPAFSCAGNEHHAFSLASAPQAPTLELYIKAVGPWTWKLRSEIMRAEATRSPYPLLHLTGPYGDGNQEWMNYEVAILVGAGIGVTPYASTLMDLVLETRSGRHHNVRCKKVYFLWVCPSHKNYEWFVDVLKSVEEEDKDVGLLETHIFVTQYFHKFDVRTTMLYIMEKHFRGSNEGMSMFTGLRAVNHFGRPNFDDFFRYIQHKHNDVDDIGVFSCGPSTINKFISHACSTANRVRDSPSFNHRFETF